MNTKLIISKAIILGSLSALASVSYGSTLYLASGASETANNSGSATEDICQKQQWSSAFSGTSWVSYSQSGKSGTGVTFTDTFNIQGSPTLASLMVMAEDTTSVSVNGVVVEAAAPASNTYKTCSDLTPGCSNAAATGLNILSDLHTGANTISFTVKQIAGCSFGLDYAATIVSADPAVASATPEPGTLALLSLPLIALSLIRRKKKQA